MLKEYYYIIVSKIDEEIGIEENDFIIGKEFGNYPTSDEIIKAIKSVKGDVARVEKRYKLVEV